MACLSVDKNKQVNLESMLEDNSVKGLKQMIREAHGLQTSESSEQSNQSWDSWPMWNEVRAPLHLSPPKLIHMPNPGDDASCEINSDSDDESQVKSSEPEE